MFMTRSLHFDSYISHFKHISEKHIHEYFVTYPGNEHNCTKNLTLLFFFLLVDKQTNNIKYGF